MFFKSKKSNSEETREVKSEDSNTATDFVKRSDARKAEGLTPENVVNKRFAPTKFKKGYDQNEVDDFLDEAVAELRRLEKEETELRFARSRGLLPTGSSPIITPEDVNNKRFETTQFRGGYDESEVDDFLDEIVVELRRRTSRNSETRSVVSKLITDLV